MPKFGAWEAAGGRREQRSHGGINRKSEGDFLKLSGMETWGPHFRERICWCCPSWLSPGADPGGVQHEKGSLFYPPHEAVMYSHPDEPRWGVRISFWEPFEKSSFKVIAALSAFIV